MKKVLTSWGPGKYDAELDKDGKAFRPDGKTAATLIPPAFGLAGVNLHTWTGFGSVTYWNAYVAATADAREGHVLRRAAQGAAAVPGRGTRRARGTRAARRTGSRRSSPRCTSISWRSRRRRRPRAASTRAAAARGASALQRQGEVRDLPRPAALHRARGTTCTRRPRSASTSFQADRSPDARLPDGAAQGAVDAPEGRVLPRRPLRRPGRASSATTIGTSACS